MDNADSFLEGGPQSHQVSAGLMEGDELFGGSF
jgi:hypothetical protein